MHTYFQLLVGSELICNVGTNLCLNYSTFFSTDQNVFYAVLTAAQLLHRFFTINYCTNMGFKLCKSLSFNMMSCNLGCSICLLIHVSLLIIFPQ